MSETLDRPVTINTMTPDLMIEKYVLLRDKEAEIKKRHVAELAPYHEVMARLEGWLLEALNQAGLSSMKAPAGTAFKTTRTSAKVIDWPATLAFIREREAWDLLEARVSKLAAQEIMAELKQPIPGVETSAELCVNVRRASATGKGK